MRRVKPSRVTMLMVPAIARAPVSAVGARRISMRSICSEVSDSRLKPGGMRWPSMSSCVKPPASPRMRGGPPRPGAPGVVTPGSRRSTSPTVASPNLSISSRPITILAVVDWRRRSVSDSRPPVISTCRPLAGSGAGDGVPAGATGGTGGADAAVAGAEAAALGAAAGADACPAAPWAGAAAVAHARTRPSGLRVAAAKGIAPLSVRRESAAGAQGQERWHEAWNSSWACRPRPGSSRRRA